MQLKTWTFFFVILFSLSFFGQSDSLSLYKKQVNNESLTQVEKFDVLGKIIVHYKSNNSDSALLYANLQLEIASKIDAKKYLAKAHSSLAKLYLYANDFANCTKNAFIAIELFKSEKNSEGQVLMHCLLGQMFASKMEFSNCYNSYEKATSIAINSGDEKLKLPIFIGIGNAKFLEKKFDEASKYFEECLVIFEKYPDFDLESKATIFTNLGNIQSGYENDYESIAFYKKSLEIYRSINDLYGASLTMFNIGDAYMFLDEYDSAQYYFELNLEVGQQLKSKEEIYYAYFGLTNLFTRMKDFEKALHFQVLSSAYKDSLQSAKYDRTVVEMQKKYESEQSQKALEIAELEIVKSRENKLKDASLIRVLWIGSISLLIILFVVIYLYRKVIKASNLIKTQSTEISIYNHNMDKTLQQKEILLKEVHHRVKNNLQIIASLLNLQMNRVDNLDAKKALDESRSRVQAIALMHKGLYQDEHYNKVELSSYLKELVTQQKLFSFTSDDAGIEINYNLNVEPILLNIDDAVPVGLILSELISNSIKHAFDATIVSPEISISIANMGEKVKVIYEDNGVGVSNNFNFENDGSLGFEIISALIEQINGDMKFSPSSHFKLELTF